MSMMNNAMRSCGTKLIASTPTAANRGFHSTAVTRMGGHGHDEPHYLHAKHMYNLGRMKHQGLKMSLAVFSVFSFGFAVPIFAVIFQQRKAKSS